MCCWLNPITLVKGHFNGRGYLPNFFNEEKYLHVPSRNTGRASASEPKHKGEDLKINTIKKQKYHLVLYLKLCYKNLLWCEGEDVEDVVETCFCLVDVWKTFEINISVLLLNRLGPLDLLCCVNIENRDSQEISGDQSNCIAWIST